MRFKLTADCVFDAEDIDDAFEKLSKHFHADQYDVNSPNVVDLIAIIEGSLLVEKIPGPELAPKQRELFKKYPWMWDFMETSEHLNNSHELVPYYRHINELIAAKKFNTIGDFFECVVQVEKLSSVLLSGLLRLTSNYSHHIFGWNDLYDNCYAELSNRGVHADQILKGLKRVVQMS